MQEPQALHLQPPGGAEIVESFVQDCVDRQLADETTRRYRSSIRDFQSHMNERGLSLLQVDRHVLHGYIRNRRSEGVDQKTIENDLSAIGGLYDFLVFEEQIPTNPVPGVRKRYLRRYKEGNDADAESPRKLISVEQMSLLANSILDTRDKSLVVLLAKTGMRRGELISLDIPDMNWANQ